MADEWDEPVWIRAPSPVLTATAADDSLFAAFESGHANFPPTPPRLVLPTAAEIFGSLSSPNPDEMFDGERGVGHDVAGTAVADEPTRDAPLVTTTGAVRSWMGSRATGSAGGGSERPVATSVHAEHDPLFW